MDVGEVLGIIIVGLLAGIIIGPLGRLLVPGKQDISIGMTILIGAVGAIAGGFIAQALGVGDTDGIDWLKFFIQIAVAAVVIVVYVNMAGRKDAT